MTDSLTGCIRLDQDILSPTQTLCHGVTFVLDQQRLLDLLAAKQRGQQLSFAADFLVAWRRYVLFGENNQLQHSWSFTLQYEGEGIVKTLIAMDGDVLQQVAADILLHRSLYEQLIEIHQWLMQQLLLQLPWRVQNRWLQPLSWCAAIALVGITVVLNIAKFTQQPLLILPALLCVVLIQWAIAKLLRRMLPRWRKQLLRALMQGYFAKNYRLRALGLKYLTKF